ncbi:MAG TPA: ATP-binding protein [Nocardioides sp.]|nr:ATP-binding protein [Nocardioides sp.]
MSEQEPAPWLVVSRPRPAAEVRGDRPTRVLLPIALAAVAVLVLVAVVGSFAARRLAEREAVNDTANTADLLARAVVQPALRNGVEDRDPEAVAAVADALTDYLKSSSVVRIKLWSADGQVVWSDEPRLLGATFGLSAEEREVFDHPATRAEVSDLDEPENRYERGNGKLLEVYRPVWTPDRTPLLFEIYAPYDSVTTRGDQLTRGFAGVTVTSLLAFAALLSPLLWQLLRRLRDAQRQRELLLQRAVDASEEERRRIAGTLHDGVVQELVAASYVVGGTAERLRAAGDERSGEELADAATTLRSSVGGLRSLLVDIYPATLEASGLRAALTDLVGGLVARGIDVHLALDEDVAPTPDQERAVFRIVQECLHNVRNHARATRVDLTLRTEGGRTVVEIADDGAGFDPAERLGQPAEGHFGLRVVADVASAVGAELVVASAPGRGCRWRLVL